MNYDFNIYKNLENYSKYIISPEIKSFNKFSPKLKIAVLASGEGSNFQVLIDLSKREKLDIEIKILITNKKNANCIKRAKESNIPYQVIDQSEYIDNSKFEEKIINSLNNQNIELIVMAGWMRIVSEEFVNAFENKIINIHPSLLPSFKGKTPINDSLKYKSLITGCSVHFVEAEVDSGKLIVQGALPICVDDNNESLTQKIHKLEHKILPFAISEAGYILRMNQG